MRTITTILLLLAFQSPVWATDYYFRADGGNKQECTGKVDAPKKINRQCSWGFAEFDIVPTSKNQDRFIISGKGGLHFSVKPVEEIKIKTDFSVYKNHLSYYTDRAFLGHSVIIRRSHKGESPDLFKLIYVGKDK